MTSRFLCFLWRESEIHSDTFVPKQSVNNTAFTEGSLFSAGFEGYRCPLGAVRDSGCSPHLFGGFFYCLHCIPTQLSAPSSSALLVLVCFTGNEYLHFSIFPHLPSLQNGAILNKGTGRCLEVENRGMAGIDLILRSCTGQRWTIKNFIK